MSLTNEHVGPMILAKIKIYVFTRAELLFQVCYETPCTRTIYTGTTLEVGLRGALASPRNLGVQKGDQKEKQIIYY